jgi:hypothetical protein
MYSNFFALFIRPLVQGKMIAQDTLNIFNIITCMHLPMLTFSTLFSNLITTKSLERRKAILEMHTKTSHEFTKCYTRLLLYQWTEGDPL